MGQVDTAYSPDVYPQHWKKVEGEEWAANLVADYAPGILSEADEIARGW